MGLYPKHFCLYCHEEMVEAATWTTLLLPKKELLCSGCREQLVRLPEKNCCATCGHPEASPCCSDCTARESAGLPLLVQRSLYPYDDFVQEMIALFKYRGDAKLAEIFAEDLRRLAVKVHGRPDLVAAIPLHKERLYERGFNQAALLAGAFQVKPLLVRTTVTAKQSKTAPEKRQENTAGAFALAPGCDVAGKKILLVDDIYTSGATLHAAAAPLIKAGARAVSAVTLARAIQKK